jgi:DNA-binding transcriptional MerR regulator
MEQRTYDTAEVADRYKVSPHTVIHWRQKGTGPRCFKPGRHWRYRERDLLAWEEEQLAKASDG